MKKIRKKTKTTVINMIKPINNGMIKLAPIVIDSNNKKRDVPVCKTNLRTFPR